MIIKTKKCGDDLMLQIPAEYNVAVGTVYQPLIDEHGTISFVPIQADVFETHPEYDFKAALQQMSIKDNGRPVGKERVW